MLRHFLLAFPVVVAAGCAESAAPDEHAGHHHEATKEPASAPTAAPAPGTHELKKLATASANYPLKTCVISGDELGGKMGPAIAYSYDGTEVQFCCPDCIDEFKKDPEKYLAQIRAAKK